MLMRGGPQPPLTLAICDEVESQACEKRYASTINKNCPGVCVLSVCSPPHICHGLTWFAHESESERGCNCMS